MLSKTLGSEGLLVFAQLAKGKMESNPKSAIFYTKLCLFNSSYPEISGYVCVLIEVLI